MPPAKGTAQVCKKCRKPRKGCGCKLKLRARLPVNRPSAVPDWARGASGLRGWSDFGQVVSNRLRWAGRIQSWLAAPTAVSTAARP